MTKRIETKNFTLNIACTDANGDTIWIVTHNKNKHIFYIHVFDTNHINIKLFNGNHINNASEAISALCNTIIQETGKTPYINIHYTNKQLIATCTKAGFRKVKKIKHLYKYKVKK